MTRAVGELGCVGCKIAIRVPPPAVEERARESMLESPYKGPEHALYLLVWAFPRASAMPSDLGSKLARLEIGEIQTSGRGQFSRELEVLGDLINTWSDLDDEDQELLWCWGETVLWFDQAQRCRSCGTEYIPAWLKRCARCQTIRFQDEELCGCGARDWLPVEVCPRCGSDERVRTRSRARRVAGAVSDYRLRLFIKAHGRKPFKRGENEEESRNFDESTKVGYCPICGGWFQDAELAKGRKCKACKCRVRWGIRVREEAVGRMVRDSLGRWRELLKGNELIG
jgi:hypothetical protein